LSVLDKEREYDSLAYFDSVPKAPGTFAAGGIGWSEYFDSASFCAWDRLPLLVEVWRFWSISAAASPACLLRWREPFALHRFLGGAFPVTDSSSFRHDRPFTLRVVLLIRHVCTSLATLAA
jgi:hypothetical protein